MPIDAFTVSVVESPGEALVTVAGDLDATTCPELASCLQPLLDDRLGDVVVDLGDVGFADSMAIHLLARVSLELLAGGRRLIVTDPSAPVVRLLSLTNLLVWFCPRDGGDV